MYHRLLKWSGIIGITAMVLSIAGMLVYSWKKPLIYVRAEEDDQTQHQTHTGQVTFDELVPVQKEDADNLCIPVAAGVTQEAIHIDSDYMNRIMTITIDGMGTVDLSDDVYGSLTGINRIQTADWKGQLIMMIVMDDVYEYGAILENQRLMLTLQAPREIYERIVVIDAGHGGSDTGVRANGIAENECVLDIAERVRELLVDEDIRVYVTRTEKENPGLQNRVLLANDVRADMYISLHLADGDAYGISARYNGTYFTPSLTNAELADLLVRRTAEAVNNRGVGVFTLEKLPEGAEQIEEGAEPEGAELYHAQVPAVYLVLGALGNDDEARLLGRDDYRQDLAAGIAQAVLEAYGRKEERRAH